MENVKISAVVDDKTKKNPAFRDLKGMSVGEYVNRYYPQLSRTNDYYDNVYNVCVQYLAEEKTNRSFDNETEEESYKELDSNFSIPISNNSEIKEPDTSLSFIEKLSQVVNDIIIYLEKIARNDTEKNHAFILKEYYINDLEKDEIKDKCGLSSRQAIENHINQFKNFDKKLSFYYLLPATFKDEINREIKNLNFKYLPSIKEEIGFADDKRTAKILDLIGLGKVELSLNGNPVFIVNTKIESINGYRRIITSLLKDLKSCFSYVTRKEFLKYFTEEFNPVQRELFTSNLINNYNIFVENEYGIRIKTEFLENVDIRQARIIYDNQGSIRNDVISKIYKDFYSNDMPPIRSSKLNKLGFHCVGTEWNFGDKPINVREFIENYVKQNNFIIQFSNLIQEIRSAGSNLNDSSLETYTTKICSRCLDDNDIMVHKDHLSDFPNLRFPKEAKQGQENIALNAIWDYLEGIGDSLDKEELVKWTKKYLKNNELNTNIARQLIDEYSSDYDLFLIKDNKITINKDKYDKGDLKFFGLGRTKEKYAKLVISFVINELQKAENKTLLFSQILEKVNNDIGEDDLRRNQIKNILELEPELIKVENDGKRLYVKLINEIESRPVYEIEATPAVESEPFLVEVKENREKLTSAITFDWDKIEEKMFKELQFYVRPSWFGMGFDLTKAIKRFRSFMESSKNQNLSYIIPQNLYEYWFCSTSQYDRNRYFCDLARCYETTLKELYIERNGAIDRNNGLREICDKYYPDLAKAFSNGEDNGIYRTLRDLNSKRNKIAHGDYVEMTSWQEAQTISNFIALYVFTIQTNGKLKKTM